MTTQKHIPVLLGKVVEVLNPQRDETYFDGTAGYGGHAAAILQRIGPNGHAILVDRDRHAIAYLRERFGDVPELVRRDYAGAAKELADTGSLVDMVLLDLGVSSPQFDEGRRGFSFQASAPLDMRMDDSQRLDAGSIVNEYSEADIANIIYHYGEEPKSRAIAREIVRQRPVTTTDELARLVERVVGRKEGIHPATRTFQALRIAVNDELGQLSLALPQLLRLLAPGGRLAVISFHSLEDRIVKEFIHRESRDCICPPRHPVCTCRHYASLGKLTRRVIKGATEDDLNPRARSAKLRAAVKIKTKKEA